MDYRKYLRKARFFLKRLFIPKNLNRTIVCNMCLGGMISHDYGLQFQSPFVNLMVPGKEFVSMLKDLSSIVESDIKELPNEGKYPLGIINDGYHLHFIHYDSFLNAKQIWYKRAKRMDLENPYLIFVETISCDYNSLVEFDKLSYKNKIALVHKPYPEIKCAYLIKNFDGINKHGEILAYTDRLGSRLYDQVNWSEFLNLK